MKVNWSFGTTPPAKVAPWTSGATRSSNIPDTFLMLDWTGTWLCVTAVAHEAGKLYLGQTHRQQIDLGSEAGQLTAAAWLASLLKRERIEAREAIVCAPRRYVAFKLLTLPAVSDDRLAEAVHLQCETLFPVAAGDLVIDFLAHPVPAQSDSRTVLVAVIPRTQIAAIQETLSAAQLQCRSIVVPELAVARNDVNVDVASEAIILLSPGKIETMVRAGGMPVLAYAAKAPREENLAADIGSTLRRLEASLPPTLLGGPISSIRILHIQATSPQPISGQAAGTQARSRMAGPAFVDQLRRQLLINVSYRCVAREEQAKADAIQSALLDPLCRIDFALPRRPIDHRRLAINQRVKVAGLLLGSVLLVWGLARVNSLRLESQVAHLQSQRQELTQQLEQEQPRWQQVARVAAWQESRLDYSRLLGAFISDLPDNQQMMLTRMELIQNTEGHCELQIDGLAKDSQCVNELLDQFISSPQYAKPQLRRLEAKAGDNRYSSEFAVTVEVVPGVRS